MILETRLTHDFAVIKTDEIETTIFKDAQEVRDTINNLLSVAIELTCYTTGTIHDFFDDEGLLKQ